MFRVGALSLALVLLVSGCSDDNQPEAADSGGSDSSTSQPGGAEGGGEDSKPSIRIVEPAGDAEVGSRFALRARTRGFPPEDGEGREVVLLAYIDKEPKAGEAAPTGDPGVRRLRRGRVGLRDLPPGQHTIVVAAANGDQVLLTPLVADTVTITVSAGAADAPAPAPESAPS